MHLRLTSTGLLLEGGIEKSDTETTVLLSHNPDSKTEVQDHPWDLMLCGHTHGGQLWIPFVGAPFAPIRDKRFVKGLRRWNNRWIHVTKGVGNLHGLRLNWRTLLPHPDPLPPFRVHRRNRGCASGRCGLCRGRRCVCRLTGSLKLGFRPRVKGQRIHL